MKLVLSLEETNLILVNLGKQPYSEVADLIAKIVTQARAQQIASPGVPTGQTRKSGR